MAFSYCTGRVLCRTIAIPGKYNKQTGEHGTPTAAEICEPECHKSTQPGGPRPGFRASTPGGPLVCDTNTIIIIER